MPTTTTAENAIAKNMTAKNMTANQSTPSFAKDGTRETQTDGAASGGRDAVLRKAIEHAKAIESILMDAEVGVIDRDLYALRLSEAMARSLVDQLDELLASPKLVPSDGEKVSPSSPRRVS